MRNEAPGGNPPLDPPIGDPEDELMKEATAWTLRLRHAGAGDWEEFTGWLEADPRHWPAYREVARADLRIGALLEQVPERTAANDGAKWGRRGFIAAAAAAAAAAAIFYVSLPPAPTLYAIETGPGERRSIELAESTRIDLNGRSRIILDKENARFARLERGEALFRVRHLPDNPFRVEASDAQIRNVGTVFNVLNEGDTLIVEVAEGAVLFSADGDQLSLVAGKMLARQAGRTTTGSRLPATIGTWRRGELVYSSASYASIARDLARNTGIDVQASPGLGGRRFSGVILLDGDREALRRRVSLLLGVNVQLAGEGWVLAPADR